MMLARTLRWKASTSSTLRVVASQQRQHCKRHCGFLAAIGDSSSSQLLKDENTLDITTARLQHRGPDGRHLAKGQFQEKVSWAMGHQRLAIVDPNNAKADMPFVLKFGDTVIHLVANGEIYNHDALYQELQNSHGWTHSRASHSDCEVIAHSIACLGPEATAAKLDGMFAFTAFIQTNHSVRVFCARDPVGIKPLYHGTTNDSSTHLFASELKALVSHVDPATVQAIPAGHYWSPDTGLVQYYTPRWLDPETATTYNKEPTRQELQEAFKAAVSKRMMADVDYGFFLSGGVDSCILSHALLPLYRQATGDDRPIPAFTVGMDDSPDMMAATAMVDALGGSRYIDHRRRIFTGQDVFDLIPKIVYHMETYETELIRSAIPNWLLAERAGADVKMVLTGEGADELFAGYLYFMDADSPQAVQNELKRIYGMLGNINLHRTDRMTMAHGLEARVPFLDTEFTRLAMQVDPRKKLVDRHAVQTNSPGREKTFLRELFNEPNANGHSIPHAVLWRAKAMQCEGVGEDWVAQLQRRVSADISDAELAEASNLYEINPPQTKEELYYRRIFEDHFGGMAHVIKAWEGGCRAAGASWESSSYTREGLVDPNVLTHAFQKKSARGFATLAEPLSNTMDESMRLAIDAGFDRFEATLTSGGDDRCMIHADTQRNKYHIQPRPMAQNAIFRGSCTCNAPTTLGYNASQMLFSKISNSTDTNETIAAIFQEQRERIADFFQLPEGTEVILCPSGSDAEYLPVAMARALHPNANIVNVVTQLKEVGAGTSVASEGLYFSTHAPLLGRVPDGVERLKGFGNLAAVCIPARDRDGSALESSKLAQEAAEEAVAQGAFPIVHGVFGGKTGLMDEIMPPSEDAGERSLGVVDACQGRFSQEELHSWLSQDSVVLITGSKFYQAPPFCGAVLVPTAVAEKVRNAPVPCIEGLFKPDGLGGFLSDMELPQFMSSWAPKLQANRSEPNVGLALRWEAALAEMESLSSVSDETRNAAVEEWSNQVCAMIQHEPDLDAWSLHGSIISVRLRHGDRWLGMDELRNVYRLMSMDKIPAPSTASAEEVEALQVTCSLGQPVDVADSHAILRIALGSESLRSYLANPSSTLKQDEGAVRKLALVAKYYEHVKDA